jgi:hypothetical protein
LRFENIEERVLEFDLMFLIVVQKYEPEYGENNLDDLDQIDH